MALLRSDSNLLRFVDALVCFFALGAFILVILRVWLPLWQQEQNLVAQIEAANQELSWLAERPNPESARQEDYQPPALDTMVLLNYLDEASQIAGVNITEVSFGDVLSKIQLIGYAVKMQLQGNYSALEQYLTQLEDSEYLIQVQRWSFLRDNFSEALSLHLELIFWGQEGSDYGHPQPPRQAGNRENPFRAP